MKRLASIFLLALMGLTATVFFAPGAYAHGERSQEAFLRMRTVGWTDTVFTGGERDAEGDLVLAQGEKFTLTGTAKLMNSWPDTLAAGSPEIGYINIATQGPVVALLERTVNGVSAPGRLEVAKGKNYAYEMTFMARRNGRWHVHPTFAVKGAGTVVGPGQWIEVKKAAGGFTTDVKLYNGDTVNLENYGLGFVWGWQVLSLIPGVIWMLWWTVPKFHRTVTNPAVTLSIPLNDDGVAVGLNSKKDHRVVNILALVMALMMLVAWVYQASAYPVKIPQQVVQFEPPLTALDEAAPVAKLNPQRASYDAASRVLTVNLETTNISDGPIQVKSLVASTLTFVNPAVSSPKDLYQAEMSSISPTGAIAPGQTVNLVMTLPGERFDREHLLPIGESQLTISGLMVFQDAAGKSTTVEYEEPLQPNFSD